MCQAIRFIKNEFTREELAAAGLKSSNEEIQIHFSRETPLLPVLLHGKNTLIPWGNRNTPNLPHTGFCKIESLEAGKWAWLQPLPINIIASSALVNGVWFQVKQAIRGLMIIDSHGIQYGYMLTQPATHYFQTMTGAERMPVLVNQIL